jgi:hypothetical protein
MAQRSATLAGFQAIFSRPSLGLAEIAWRWSFGFATVSLLGFSVLEYLDSLPVTSRDEFMFRTRQPALISRALAHILRGSSLRLIAAAILLAVALSFAWILLGALGRGLTLGAMREHFHDGVDSSGAPEQIIRGFRLRSLVGLNFLRAAATVAAVVGCLAAFLAAGAASPASDPSPGTSALICFFIAMLAGVAWAILNWFLSTASIFVVAEGRDTFGAIAGAVGLSRDRLGPVLAASAWFGLAHMAVFVVASTVVGFPVVFAGLLPPGVVVGGVLVVALLYFAVVDYLYVGRLAAYFAVLSAAEVLPMIEMAHRPAGGDLNLTASIDRSELILSDLPHLIPEI